MQLSELVAMLVDELRHNGDGKVLISHRDGSVWETATTVDICPRHGDSRYVTLKADYLATEDREEEDQNDSEPSPYGSKGNPCRYCRGDERATSCDCV